MKILTQIFFLSIFLTSCSSIKRKFFSKKNKLSFNGYVENNNKDYHDHLAHYGQQYIKLNRPKLKYIDKRTRAYIQSLSKKILDNNIHLVEKKLKTKLYVVDKDIPFHFSLPGGIIVFSVGLLKKYVENEGVLVSILSFEIIKSLRGLYKKQTLIPRGYVKLKPLISILRLPLKMRNELNRWAFLAVRRAGYDEGAYLVWLQTQNKNSLSFSTHHGGVGDISKEEFLFKRFLIDNSLSTPVSIEENHSSREFYRFKKIIRKM